MKKTKIIISMLLLFAMLISLAINVFADYTVSKEGVLYVTLDDGTAAVIGCNGHPDIDSFTIPESVDGIPVTQMLNPLESRFMFVKNLTIPEHVKFIGQNIGVGGTGAVYENVVIHANGLVLDEWAFAMRKYIETVTITGKVDSIGPGAFFDCTNLKSITLPDSITEIPRGMFAGCTSLESITIPDSVTVIDSHAFYGCSALKTVNMSKNISYIASDAFENTDFESAFLTASDDGVIYGGDIVVGFDREKIGESIALKEGTKGIADLAFYGASMKEIVLPDSVEYIGYEAFSWCGNLESIVMSDNLERIDQSAFSRTALKTVRIPASVKFVGNHAFYLCESLTDVVIEDGATGFNDGVFRNCTSLKEITIPGSLKEIPSSILSGCSSLRKVFIEEGITFIGRGAFGSSGITELTIPYTVDTIEAGIIRDSVHLSNVYYGGSETEWENINYDNENNWLFVYATFHYNDSPVEHFTDMPKVSDWRHPGLRYCVGQGIMAGTSQNTISPDMITTRAQLVTLLWRLQGSPVVDTDKIFTDLTDDWYVDAVMWAAETGITQGVGDGLFAPDREITREQLATILYRYTGEYKGQDTSATEDIGSFPDASEASEWAITSLSWACGEGLITGSNDGGVIYLDPAGDATRAQVATILTRFCEKFE